MIIFENKNIYLYQFIIGVPCLYFLITMKLNILLSLIILGSTLSIMPSIIDNKNNTNDNNDFMNKHDKICNLLLSNYSIKIMPFYEGRDESHGYSHVVKVAKNAILISKSHCLKDTELKIMILIALLHDVYDPKYVKGNNSEIIQKMSIFLHSIDCTSHDIEIIFMIISVISFSKEKRLREERNTIKPIIFIPNKRHQLIRDIVSDADKMEALGKIGLIRMIQYKNDHIKIDKKKYTYDWYNEHLTHIYDQCNDKLSILLSDYYIRTDQGRELSKILEKELKLITNNDELLREYIRKYTN